MMHIPSNEPAYQRVISFKQAIKYLEDCGEITFDKLREAMVISGADISEEQLQALWAEADNIIFPIVEGGPTGKEAIRFQMRKILINGIATLEQENSFTLDQQLLMSTPDGSLDDVNEFISGGASVNSSNNKGETALMMAAYSGNHDVVKYLIEAGADLTAKDNDGATVLLWAAMKGSKAILYTLIEHGADMNEKTNDGITALMIAEQKGDEDIVKLLEHTR